MRSVSLLEVLDDTESVKIVIEAAAMLAQAKVQGTFASMSEGWVADVVNQSERLSQIFVESKGCGDLAGYLRYLYCVRQSGAEVIGDATGKHLRLARQSAKGTRLYDPLTITLKGGPESAVRSLVDAGQKWDSSFPGYSAGL